MITRIWTKKIELKMDRNRNTITEVEGKVLQFTQHEGSQVSLRIHCPSIAERSKPGQFIHVRCSQWLEMRRPMSLMKASPKEGWIDILFKITGVGTKALSQTKPGDSLKVLGPIGTPFRLKNYRKHVVLIGGGVGIPPLLFLAEHLKKSTKGLSIIVFMGSEVNFPFKVRPSKIYMSTLRGEAIAGIPLLEDLGIPSRLASNQGFPGCYRGHVTDLAKEYFENLSEERENIEIFACGPEVMLIETQKIAETFAKRSQISVEESMACAIGGCAGCTIPVQTKSGLAMKRVCVDGPVFDGAEVILS